MGCHGVAGRLLEEIRTFYKNASACLHVNGELRESSGVGLSGKQE